MIDLTFEMVINPWVIFNYRLYDLCITFLKVIKKRYIEMNSLDRAFCIIDRNNLQSKIYL